MDSYRRLYVAAPFVLCFIAFITGSPVKAALAVIALLAMWAISVKWRSVNRKRALKKKEMVAEVTRKLLSAADDAGLPLMPDCLLCQQRDAAHLQRLRNGSSTRGGSGGA